MKGENGAPEDREGGERKGGKKWWGVERRGGKRLKEDGENCKRE